MTTPLFLLRCVEVGISIRDLDLLTIGLVVDMWTERANDSVSSGSGGKGGSTVRVATQKDFDVF